MERLTVDTNILFCDIAQCREVPGGTFCKDGYCDQRRCYERLREYERLGTVGELTALAKARDDGRVVVLPFVAMVEQSLQDGNMKPERDQRFNGRYAVVYSGKGKWGCPLIDICGTTYNSDQAKEHKEKITRAEAEAALKGENNNAT